MPLRRSAARSWWGALSHRRVCNVLAGLVWQLMPKGSVCLWPMKHRLAIARSRLRLFAYTAKPEREVCEPCFGWDMQGPGSPGAMIYSPPGSTHQQRNRPWGWETWLTQPGGPGAALQGVHSSACISAVDPALKTEEHWEESLGDGVEAAPGGLQQRRRQNHHDPPTTVTVLLEQRTCWAHDTAALPLLLGVRQCLWIWYPGMGGLCKAQGKLQHLKCSYVLVLTLSL